MTADKLLCDAADKARIEAENGAQQLLYIESLVSGMGITQVRLPHVQQLHELAIAGIFPCGGRFRDALSQVFIQGSAHVLPEAAFVPGHVEDLLRWVNDLSRPPLERAAYALWRMNWIHPFRGGNGRTSRALTYLILCAGMERMLPGVPAMPSIIYDRRDDYIRALQACDALAASSPDSVDISPMTGFLEAVLTMQLAHAIQAAAGRTPRT